MDEYDRQRARIELHLRLDQWLSESEAKRGPLPNLTRGDIEVMSDALFEATSVPPLRRTAEKIDQARRVYWESKKPRAALRELGITDGKRGRKHQREQIADEYVWLLGREPDPGWMMAPPVRADGSSVYPDRPLDTADALRAVAKEWGFPSNSACRDLLLRARKELKERRGDAAHFPIPNPARLLS